MGIAATPKAIRLGYKQTEVGVIPEDWRVVTVKEVAAITTGKRNTQDRVEDGVYPFYVRSQTVERINSYSYDGEAVLTAGDGVGTGKVFHYIVGKFDCHQRVYRISDFLRGVNGFFFFLYFSNHFYGRIMSMTAKSSVDSVRLEMIADMKIPMPPEPEQHDIAEVLRDAAELISVLDKLITKKRDLKHATMQRLLTGKQRLPGFAQARTRFKQTEVGVIPEDWEVDALGELFSISGGFSATRDQLGTEGYCYLHYGDIHKSTKTFLDVGAEYQDIPKLNIPLQRVSSKSLLATGDVVFVDASEDDEGTSKHIVVVNNEKLPYISGLHTIVAKSKTISLDNGYKQYCFQTRDIKRQFYYYAVGTKVSGVSKTNIRKILIPHPSIPEQRAIAAVLSDMDAEIAALEQRRDKTRDLKQGMMQELLTGKTRLI